MFNLLWKRTNVPFAKELWATSCSVNSFCTVSSDLRQIKSTLLTTPGSWVTTGCSMRLRSNMFLSQVLVSLSISNSKSIFSRTISSFRRFSRSYSSWICRVCEIKSSRMAIVRFRAAWRSARLPVCARTSAAARAACSFARWWLKPFARASSSGFFAGQNGSVVTCSVMPTLCGILWNDKLLKGPFQTPQVPRGSIGSIWRYDCQFPSLVVT